MFCPRCGKELSQQARFCPNCGYNLNEKKEITEKTKEID